MDAKLKKKWLKALRSGEYIQGQGHLCSYDGKTFCCLGVLADIQGAVWAKKTDRWLGRKLYPEIKGIKPSAEGTLLDPREAGGLRTSTMQNLAEMNDNGKSFEEIADYIERRL